MRAHNQERKTTMTLQQFLDDTPVTDPASIGPGGWKIQRGFTDVCAAATKGLSWVRPTIKAAVKRDKDHTKFPLDAEVLFERRPSAASGIMSTCVTIGSITISRDAYGLVTEETDTEKLEAAKAKAAVTAEKVAAKKAASKPETPAPAAEAETEAPAAE